jgi:hypothetical protein
MPVSKAYHGRSNARTERLMRNQTDVPALATKIGGVAKWFIRQVAPFQSCPKLEEP